MNFIPRRVTVVLAAGALTFGLASVAVAQTESSVTQTITAGARSASVADLQLGATTYSHSSQSSAGTMVLSADDSSGTGEGWKVTVQSSEFAYTGTNGGTAIPAANFALTSAAEPTMVAGQGIDTGGPRAVTTTGTLDQARTVISADAGSGQGDYRQDLGVSLDIPAQTRAGTYTGTLTTTITAGPAA